MGMDVYGNNAKTKKGEYFRNNVWWWRPLADFVCETYPEIANSCENWHTNDGDGLNEEDSKVLGQMILNDINNGTVLRYHLERNKALAELPREDCIFCDKTGIRTDKVGITMGMDKIELKSEEAILLGRTHGTCNACGGHGTKEHWAIGYPFDINNAHEFAEFLIDCGGFKIC